MDSQNLKTEKAIRRFVLRLYRTLRFASQRERYNRFVKAYYKRHKAKDFVYEKNIWCRNYFWDFFLQSLPHGVKSKYYVPADYYAFEIEAKMNREFKCFCLEKNVFERLFSNCGIAMPETVLRCMNNIYLDAHYNLVDDLERVCNSIREDIIVKPSVEACCGAGIRKYSFTDSTLHLSGEESEEFDIEKINRYYKGDFLIQKIVKQNAEIAKFHPYSLNTIRVFSYRSVRTNEVHITAAMLRMGINGSYLDNASIDGIACGIEENGTLMKYAFDQFGNYYDCHPTTKSKFEDFTIPSFSRVIESVKRLANILPHQRLIGWDFGIDHDGNPVLIELNIGTGTWMLQIANGRPLFGAFSQEVKDYMDAT